MSRVSKSVSLLACLLWAACASTPFPGDERIDDGPEFDATSPMPQAESASANRGKSARPPETKKSLAETYKEPGSKLPSAKLVLDRHYQKCRPASASASLVLPGQVVLESPDRKLLGPYELTVESGGRFRERMTLAASADEHDYGQGVDRERGSDGTIAWRKDGQAGAYFVDDVEKAIFAVDARLFLGRWDEVLKNLKTVAETQFGGFPAHQLQGQTQSGELIDLYIHRDTFFLLGRIQVNTEAPDEPLSKLLLFELSTHAGFCIPARMEITNGEEQQMIKLGTPKSGPPPKPINPPAELRGLGGME